jgi:dTDP-4-dehydrorhamnose 3,5-epimerase-like enzyme
LTFDGAGVVRGNHFHNHSSEVFCLIAGSVEIMCEAVETKERMSKVLKIENNQFYKIFIGPKIAHAIKSLSEFAVIVSFSSEEYHQYIDDKIEYVLV